MKPASIRTHLAPLDPADVEILAIVRASATGRHHAAAHRRALQEKACLFVDFKHFSRLCIGDLEQAFVEDRDARTGIATDATSRMTKNRRRCWLAAYRCYARYAGIAQDIEIAAVDRRGHYTCRLIDKTPRDDWEKLVRLAADFGIEEEALCGCLPTEMARVNHATTRGQPAIRLVAGGARIRASRQ